MIKDGGFLFVWIAFAKKKNQNQFWKNNFGRDKSELVRMEFQSIDQIIFKDGVFC